jgi:hypothetical protein
MSTSPSAAVRCLLLGFALLGLTACAGMSTVSDVLAAGNVLGLGQEVSGQVRQVDTRRQQIQVEVSRGRTERLQYDGRTEVVYQQRRYSVRDLERGDYVRVRVEEPRRGQLYARRIQVQQSVRDQRGSPQANVRVQRLEGQVGRIDTQRGWFEVHPTRGDVVMVTLPYEPSRALRDRFRRLRRGDSVRIEGQQLNRTRMEIHRFL